MVRDSSVGIATVNGLDGPEIESRWGARFSAHIQTRPGATQPPVQWLPGLYLRSTEVGVGFDHPPPPTGSEVKERVELCLYSPLGLRGLF